MTGLGTMAVAAVAVAVLALGLGLRAGAGYAAPASAPGATLDAVRGHGQLRCGVAAGMTGFSERDGAGNWHGFNVDYCRAVAAAVLGDAGRVVFVPSVGAQQGLAALARGEIDLLNRNLTLSLKRLAELGLHPVGVTFLDGQGFLVRRGDNIQTLRDLDGRRICFQSGGNADDNLRDSFSARRITFVPVARAGLKDLIRVFFEDGCDALSGNASTLAALQINAPADPDRYVLLPQRISKEPFGPLVRRGDDGWLEIARWTLMAMIEAEELGVSRTNVEAMGASTAPQIRSLLGLTPGLGRGLGLDDRWGYRILSQVGNYGDSFTANLGAAGPLRLDRGLNELWTHGGLLFAFPLR